MAVLEVTGQPVAGVIGGLKDLGVEVATVDHNFTSANRADVFQGFTSPEQGSDYDAAVVNNTETLSPDRIVAAVKQSAPFLLIAGLVAAVFFVASWRKK